MPLFSSPGSTEWSNIKLSVVVNDGNLVITSLSLRSRWCKTVEVDQESLQVWNINDYQRSQMHAVDKTPETVWRKPSSIFKLSEYLTFFTAPWFRIGDLTVAPRKPMLHLNERAIVL
jgi:hypothetical protein